MIVKFIPNVLEKNDRETYEVEYKPQSVGQYWEDLFGGKEKDGYLAIVSGGMVDWDYVPCKDDEVIFINDLTGDNMLSGLLSAVVGVALIGASFLFGAAAPYLMGAGISMLVGAAVGMAVQAFMGAPAMPEMPTYQGMGGNSRTYSWQGIKNLIGEGNVIPVVYGEHRMGGAVIEAFIDGESQNGTQARSYLNALFAVSEGPIHGVDIDSVQIQNKELAYYGDDVQVWTRPGEMEQTPIENFSKVVRHYQMTSTIRIAQGDSGQYIYKTYNEVDAAKVTVKCPMLYQMDQQTSDRSEFSVNMWLEYAPVNDPANWTVGATSQITGNTTSSLEHDYYVEFPAKGQYLIKVYRETPDYDGNSYIQDTTYLNSVSEIELSTLRYPYTALFGVRIKANDKLSGAMPNFTAMVQGRKIADVRDGSVTLASAKNPANILYDLITNNRYGLRRYHSSIGVNLDSLKELADWCDEPISYEKWNPILGAFETVQQKRYEMNIVLDEGVKAIDAITKIANSCRAIPYWVGDEMRFVIERQDTPAQLFSMGNIIRDSFEETYIGMSEIPNQVEVQILDEENDYKRQQVMAVDRARLNEDIITKSLNLFGITDKARAKRELVFALKKLKALRRTIKFKASIEAIQCEVGDLIWFQHDVPQYGFGGRVIGTSGTTISLDREVPLEVGTQYRLRIRKTDGAFAVYTWNATSTVTTSILDVGTTVDPAVDVDDVWVCGEINKEAMPFRVNSITQESKAEFLITASEYNESIFGDDTNIEIVETNYSQLGLVAKYDIDGTIPDEPSGTPTLVERPGNGEYDIPPLVIDVSAAEKLTLVGNVYRSDIEIMFAPVEMELNSAARIAEYKVIYSTDGGNTWTTAGTVSSHGYYRITNAEVGKTYYIHVKPYTNFGRTNMIELSSHKLDNEVMVNGKNYAPMAPTDLTANGETFLNKLKWTASIDQDIDYYEIWASGFNNRATAVQVGTSKGSWFTHAGLTQDQAYYYWVRAFDTAGNVSAWLPFDPLAGVSCTPLNDPAKVLSLLNGSITEGQLSAALNTKIDTGGGVKSQVELLQNQWTVKIQEDNYIVGTGLVLYPEFDPEASYLLGEYVWAADNEAYKCIKDNPAPSVAPTDPTGAAYWQLVAYGAKSEFIIKADKFAVVNPDDNADTRVPFIVGTINGVSTVGVDGNLVVDGSITGNKIHAQSEITLNAGGKLSIGANGLIEMNEGGKQVIGNQNIIIDSMDNSVVVAPDGGPAGHDFAKLTDGDIQFFYYNNTTGSHELYSSMRRFEHGVAQNGTTVRIPGMWKSQPRIMIAPNIMGTFDPVYSAQGQSLRMDIQDIELQPGYTSRWQFKPAAMLQLTDGVQAGEQLTVTVSDNTSSGDCQTAIHGLPVNTRQLEVSVSMTYRGYTTYIQDGTTFKSWKSLTGRLTLYYKWNGLWRNISSGTLNFPPAASTVMKTFNTGATTGDIVQWYVAFDGDEPGVAWPDVMHYLSTLNVNGYTGSLASATILQSGWVNWWAIGN